MNPQQGLNTTTVTDIPRLIIYNTLVAIGYIALSVTCICLICILVLLLDDCCRSLGRLCNPPPRVRYSEKGKPSNQIAKV